MPVLKYLRIWTKLKMAVQVDDGCRENVFNNSKNKIDDHLQINCLPV